MKVTGDSVYDDADYAVLSNWLFRLTHGRLGSLSIFVKGSKLAFPVSSREKAYLTAIIGHIIRRGLRPAPSTTTTQLFREFAEAVCSRGGWAWQVYFTTKTAEEKANELFRPP